MLKKFLSFLIALTMLAGILAPSLAAELLTIEGEGRCSGKTATPGNLLPRYLSTTPRAAFPRSSASPSAMTWKPPALPVVLFILIS